MDTLKKIYQKNPIDGHYYVHWIAAMIAYVLTIIVFSALCGKLGSIRGFVDENGNRWHYQKYEGTDSLGGNISQPNLAEVKSNLNVLKSKALCSKNPSCYGFNTAGELKHLIPPQDEWVADLRKDLYIKVPGKKRNSFYPDVKYEGSFNLVPKI